MKPSDQKSHELKPNGLSLYWAADGFQEELRRELELRRQDLDVDLQILQEWPGAFLVSGPPLSLAWSQSTWRNLQTLEFQSIREASRFLEPLAQRWTAGSFEFHRRAQLIFENLRGMPAPWRDFRENLQQATWGGFCLVDEKRLFYSTDIEPRLPLQGPSFREDKEAPSRAYLKLWEAFHRLGAFPQPGDRCLDLGACPGGWTWVLRKLGAEVWAADRAELAPALMQDPKVHFIKGDGFRLKPSDLPKMDWVFSDVICYPSRLLEWVQPWLELPQVPNMLCTLKFQGETDFNTQFKFAAIPHSQVVHLFQNKHEVTWICIPRG